MIIRTSIMLLLSVYAFYIAMRYNMHMFQLNGYKNGEHWNRMNKNMRQQWLLGWIFLVGVVRFLTDSIVWDIVAYISLILIILEYSALKRLNTKKKLVYTARVMRMVATIVVVALIVLIVLGVLLGIEKVSAIALILVSLQWCSDIVANVINSPIEHAVKNYYINDAKRMLRESPQLKIIGVTGSYGKTSVKFYLKTLLGAKYNVLVTPESFNTPMGVVRTIRESMDSRHEVFICEMGARHMGDIKEICDIVHPHHGVITSIGPQHLETFFNMENIVHTKFELADALPQDGMLFLNGDNDYINKNASKYANPIFYHAQEENDGYCARNIKLSKYGTDFEVVAPNGESEQFQMKLIGEHNVINVMGAIAVAHKMGIALKDLRVPVRKLQPVEHRMQMREHGAVTIIDDAYNSNPVGSKAAVETLAMFDGVRILITPGMVELGEKEEEFNYKFGTYAANCCDYIFLVGKKHTRPIQDGVLSKDFPKEKCVAFDKLEDAVSYAYAIKEQGHKYILLENDLPDNY